MDATPGAHGRDAADSVNGGGQHARRQTGLPAGMGSAGAPGAHLRRPLRTAAGVAFTLLLLGGCLSIEHDTRYRSLAATDSEEMFNQIVPGRTTRAWLTERLGSPDALWRDAAEHDVLRYDNVREHRTSVSLFPLIDVDVNNEDVERYFFEFADGTLVRYWRATGEGVELLQPPPPEEPVPPALATAGYGPRATVPAATARAREAAVPAPPFTPPAGQAPAEHPAAGPAADGPAARPHSNPASSTHAPAAQGQLDRGPIERTL